MMMTDWKQVMRK